ncbi:MAG: GntR family transcriptional regulator [Firmicutes bacterium]|nr:GntR family transcriptional regulator [Bacillota bacterium]
MIMINYRDSRPIYEQIKAQLIQLLITGGIASGQKLPSVRDLAQQLAINPNTIQRAYRELEAEGYIYSVPGKGSFACTDSEAAAAQKKTLLKEYVELVGRLRSLGLSDEELLEAMKEGEAK